MTDCSARAISSLGVVVSVREALCTWQAQSLVKDAFRQTSQLLEVCQ